MGSPAIAGIESLLLDEELGEKLEKFNSREAMVFVSGQINVDNPESIRIIQDPRQFPTIRASKSGNITLEATPLTIVGQILDNSLAKSQLQVRSINVSQTTR
ncbi:hypothetical protein C7Y66_09830 [Chroococcidiopsis sp. CCALA 051]|nr:hypothetical protein C7Y66_09830 [Chroococcidiopsis sp. CCALA 051]